MQYINIVILTKDRFVCCSSVADEVYSRNASCALIHSYIYLFFIKHVISRRKHFGYMLRVGQNEQYNVDILVNIAAAI